MTPGQARPEPGDRRRHLCQAQRVTCLGDGVYRFALHRPVDYAPPPGFGVASGGGADPGHGRELPPGGTHGGTSRCSSASTRHSPDGNVPGARRRCRPPGVRGLGGHPAVPGRRARSPRTTIDGQRAWQVRVVLAHDAATGDAICNVRYRCHAITYQRDGVPTGIWGEHGGGVHRAPSPGRRYDGGLVVDLHRRHGRTWGRSTRPSTASPGRPAEASPQPAGPRFGVRRPGAAGGVAAGPRQEEATMYGDTTAIRALARRMREQGGHPGGGRRAVGPAEAVPWTGLAAEAMRRLARDHAAGTPYLRRAPRGRRRGAGAARPRGRPRPGRDRARRTAGACAWWTAPRGVVHAVTSRVVPDAVDHWLQHFEPPPHGSVEWLDVHVPGPHDRRRRPRRHPRPRGAPRPVARPAAGPARRPGRPRDGGVDRFTAGWRWPG